MEIVHIQTQISVTFGVLDDEGNAIPQQPVTATVGKFSRMAWDEAFDGVATERDRLREHLTDADRTDSK